MEARQKVWTEFCAANFLTNALLYSANNMVSLFPPFCFPINQVILCILHTPPPVWKLRVADDIHTMTYMQCGVRAHRQ